MTKPSHQLLEAAPARIDGWVDLRLLDAVESGRFRSQRQAAVELGIAVGLVNAYVERCIKKGWLTIFHVPARRYAYLLIRLGFSEKAQLPVRYLRGSMNFFRKARADYTTILRQVRGARIEAGGARRDV